MAAKIRDLLKTRRQRVGEVYSALHLGNGQFDAQLVAFGGDLAPGATNTQLAITALEGVVNGAIVNVAATAGLAVPAGAATTAGQFRKVLVQVDKAGALTTKVGAVSTTTQLDAVRPKPDVNTLELGWLELPASFTPGTTPLTGAMCVKTPYWGSN